MSMKRFLLSRVCQVHLCCFGYFVLPGYFQCSSDLIMLLFDGFYTNRVSDDIPHV